MNLFIKENFQKRKDLYPHLSRQYILLQLEQEWMCLSALSKVSYYENWVIKIQEKFYNFKKKFRRIKRKCRRLSHGGKWADEILRINQEIKQKLAEKRRMQYDSAVLSQESDYEDNTYQHGI
jgi:hypothetical protein